MLVGEVRRAFVRVMDRHSADTVRRVRGTRVEEVAAIANSRTSHQSPNSVDYVDDLALDRRWAAAKLVFVLSQAIRDKEPGHWFACTTRRHATQASECLSAAHVDTPFTPRKQVSETKGTRAVSPRHESNPRAAWRRH